MDEAQFKSGLVAISLSLILLIAMMLFTCSCTISFQNISTHGTATDLVDEEQKTDAEISPALSIPLTP